MKLIEGTGIKDEVDVVEATTLSVAGVIRAERGISLRNHQLIDKVDFTEGAVQCYQTRYAMMALTFALRTNSGLNRYDGVVAAPNMASKPPTVMAFSLAVSHSR